MAGSLQVWDTSAAGASAQMAEGPAKLQTKAAVVAHDKDINAVAVSPDDALACTASQDRTVKVGRLPGSRRLLRCSALRPGLAQLPMQFIRLLWLRRLGHV